MDVSRILFTKETKERINKPSTVSEKGKLRWQKIKDADLATDMTMDENAPKGLGIQSVLWGAILMEKIDKVISERQVKGGIK